MRRVRRVHCVPRGVTAMRRARRGLLHRVTHRTVLGMTGRILAGIIRWAGVIPAVVRSMDGPVLSAIVPVCVFHVSLPNAPGSQAPTPAIAVCVASARVPLIGRHTPGNVRSAIVLVHQVQ